MKQYKETSTLSIVSAGRFELGIGAGDYFEEARAWGTDVPGASARIAGLKETITVLRRIWKGEQVTFEGEQLHLKNAASTPIPPAPPHVVVGAAGSRPFLLSGVEFGDEQKGHADEGLVRL